MSLSFETNSAALAELATRLDGRPVPQLRMSEIQFDRWARQRIRAEWVDGEVVVMAPVSGDHSDLNVWLLRVVADFVEQNDLGIVRGPEFQIRLASQRRRRCPDVMFIPKAKVKNLRPMYLDGAPDLVIEVVSPDSESRDWREKYLEYEAAGVREYWVVERPSCKLEVYSLSRQKRFERLDDRDGVIRSKVLRGFELKTSWLWQSPLPKLSAIARELKRR